MSASFVKNIIIILFTHFKRIILHMLVVVFRNANIQLFRERLSEKVHATIPKGIVGGFEFTVVQRNLKE